jgi:hypothetical protein
MTRALIAPSAAYVILRVRSSDPLLSTPRLVLKNLLFEDVRNNRAFADAGSTRRPTPYSIARLNSATERRRMAPIV